MKQQPFEHHTLSSIGVNHAVFLFQGCIKVETSHPCQFLKPAADDDAEWAAGMQYLFDDANEKIGDVQRTIECFMRGAQSGNANCMRQLASCYESGCGVPQDLSKAREWRAKAWGII